VAAYPPPLSPALLVSFYFTPNLATVKLTTPVTTRKIGQLPVANSPSNINNYATATCASEKKAISATPTHSGGHTSTSKWPIPNHEFLSPHLKIIDPDLSVVQHGICKPPPPPSLKDACRIYFNKARCFLNKHYQIFRSLCDVSDIYLEEYKRLAKKAYVKWKPIVKTHAHHTASCIIEYSYKAWDWAAPRVLHLLGLTFTVINTHVRSCYQYTKTDEFWDGVVKVEKVAWKGFCFGLETLPTVIEKVAVGCGIVYEGIRFLAKVLTS